MEPKYKVGDGVVYINDYCVNWGLQTITGIDLTEDPPSYYIGSIYPPWVSYKEKNLYVPGTEPSFDLVLNNGLLVQLKYTDDNANRIYEIDGKRAMLLDGSLYAMGGDWDEPSFPLKEEYQPKPEQGDNLFHVDDNKDCHEEASCIAPISPKG